jgi:hypothetical protein
MIVPATGVRADHEAAAKGNGGEEGAGGHGAYNRVPGAWQESATRRRAGGVARERADRVGRLMMNSGQRQKPNR